jgi:prophage antirepressor-like protein
MNELQIFQNKEFGNVRVIEIDGEPWFVGKDVAHALGYAKERNAVWMHVDSDDKKDAPIQGDLGGTQQMTIINESGMYSLIMSSKLQTAKHFKHWVTAEVLPAIRKTGSYNQLPTGQNLIALALIEANKMLEEKDSTIKVQEQIIGEMKPKADYVDDILKNKSLLKISSIAKDYGMSGQAMNNLLHALKVQYKSGDQWLLYAKHQSSGFTSSETVSFTRTDGRTDVKLITKWTQKGRLFLYELLKKQGVVPMIERKEGGIKNERTSMV